MPRLSFRIPLRFLRGSYSRLVLTVIALACGVALVCAIDLVNRAVLRAFSEVIDTMAGRAALQVSAGGSGLFPEEVAQTVAAVPGVEFAVPVVSATAFTVDDSGDLLTVHGIDLTDYRALSVYEPAPTEIGDSIEFLSQPDSILLTRTFAEKKGLELGRAIVLETPIGRRSFTVRGLLDPKGIARSFGGNLVVMDLFAAEEAFTKSKYISRVDVVANPEAQLFDLQKSISEVLPPGLKVEAPEQRKADLNRAMRSLQFLLRAVGFVALIAAFLISFNRLSGVFEARVWQMGLLKALGLTQAEVLRELVKESLLLGAAGVVLGVPAGIGLGQLLLPVIATTTALNYKLIAPTPTLTLHASSIGASVGLGLVAAVTSAVLPAWRVSRALPIEAIRGRGTELPDESRAPLRMFRSAVTVLLFASLAMQAITSAPIYGLFATLLTILAVSLAARPLLEAFNRKTGQWWSGLAGPSGRFAAAFVRMNPRRFARSAALLGVGLGTVFWLGMIANSFRQSALDNLGQAMKADLVVSSANIAAGYLEVPVDEGLLTRLSAVNGVDAAIGVRIVDWHYAGGDIAIDAFDPEYFRGGMFGHWPLLDSAADAATVWMKVAKGEGVVVSSNLVLNLGNRIGDYMEINTPRGPLRLEILGVTTDFASPRGTIEMSRHLYRQLWNDPTINRAFVSIKDGIGHERVRFAIVGQLGSEYRLKIISGRQLMDYFSEQIGRAFAPLDILAAMVLVVVLVGMSDSVAAGMLERTHDVGAMRAIGARRRHVILLALLEALVPGVLGYLLALATGLVLGTLWVWATFRDLLGWALDLCIPWSQFATTGVIALSVCIAAAILPALAASRLGVAESLRYE